MNFKEIKKIGEELEAVVTPMDDDDNPISLIKGNRKQVEKKILDAAGMLEEDDQESCSDELVAGLIELGAEIPWDTDLSEEDTEKEEVPDFSEMSKKELIAYAKEKGISMKGKLKLTLPKLADYVEAEWITLSEEPEEPEEDQEQEEGLTWEDIAAMNRKALEKICGDQELVTDPDDYDKDALDDFREDVAIELEIEVPEPEEEEEEEPKETAKEKKARLKKEAQAKKEAEKVSLEDDERSVEEILTDTSKLADLKEMVTYFPEFKKIRAKAKKIAGLQGPRELKPLMYKALGIDPPKNAPAKKASGKKRFTRFDSVCAVIKKSKKELSLEDLSSDADDMYEGKGGKSNPKESAWAAGVVLSVLASFEVDPYK